MGVAIGSNPRLARIAQPLAQIAASVPATALFPILLLALVQIGGGMGIGSIALMLLGTQWYILFNVIAGAIAIPMTLRKSPRSSTSPRPALENGHPSRHLSLPRHRPRHRTAEPGRQHHRGVLPHQGPDPPDPRPWRDYQRGHQRRSVPRSLLSTIAMAMMVVTTNRLVWRPLFRLAESRYKLS